METLLTFNELVAGVNADFANVFSEAEYDYKPFTGSLVEGQLEKPAVPLFEVESTDNFEDHFISTTTVGDLVPTGQTSSIAYEDRLQGYRRNMYQQWYTKGIQVNNAEILFRKYQDKLDEMRALTIAGQKTKDKIAFLGIYGASTNSAFPGGDGVALASAAHPRKDGGANQSNTSSTTYNEANQETARIALAAYYDNKGNLITASGQKMIVLVPIALGKTAQIINNGEFRSGGNNNDINIYDGNVTVVETSLVSALASFTFSDGTTVTGSDTAVHFIDPGVFKPKVLIGKELTYDYTVDFDNKSAKYSIDMYESFGHVDWRGYYRFN